MPRCKEIDPAYVPSEDEVVEYAKWLGMDLEKDQDLFWVAREGLMAPLPKNWKPCKTKDTEVRGARARREFPLLRADACSSNPRAGHLLLQLQQWGKVRVVINHVVLTP